MGPPALLTSARAAVAPRRSSDAARLALSVRSRARPRRERRGCAGPPLGTQTAAEMLHAGRLRTARPLLAPRHRGRRATRTKRGMRVNCACNRCVAACCGVPENAWALHVVADAATRAGRAAMRRTADAAHGAGRGPTRQAAAAADCVASPAKPQRGAGSGSAAVPRCVPSAAHRQPLCRPRLLRRRARQLAAGAAAAEAQDGRPRCRGCRAGVCGRGR